MKTFTIEPEVLDYPKSSVTTIDIRINKKEFEILTENFNCIIDEVEFVKIIDLNTEMPMPVVDAPQPTTNATPRKGIQKFLSRTFNRLAILPLTLPLCLLLVLGVGNVWGQISLTNGSPSNTQNFDGMGSSTTAAVPTNWKITAAGAGSSAGWSTAGNLSAVTQGASSGAPTAGGSYNWGSSASERALGFMTSGSFASPNGIMAFYVNGGTSNITSLTISYDLERYRINTAAASVTFFYSTDGSTWTSVSGGDIAGASLVTGTSAYSFAPSGTPSSTNCGVINKTSISISSLSIASSSSFYLKWVLNTTGANSQGIGIDNVVCTATFAAVSNTVTFNANGGTGSMSNQTASTSTALTTNAFTRTGYTFAGWNTIAGGGGTSYANGASYPFTSSTTLYAQWTANTLSVTYDSQGGSAITNGSTTTGGSIASSPGTPTRAGYTFNGWFAASTGGSAITFPYTHGQTANFTLYAQWTANTLTITYDSQGGSAISSGSTTTGGSIASSPGTPTKAGYTFNGWFAASTGGSAITFPYTHGQTANFTLYAQWTANTLTVTYDSQGGSAISSGSTTTGGSIASSPGTPTKAGYTFNGWFAASTGGSAITFPYTHGQTASFTLYAQWSSNSNTITFDGNGATGGSTAAQNINTAATANLTANGFTRSGYTFTGWNTAANGSGSPYSNQASYTMGTSNVTLYAQWTLASSPTITGAATATAFTTTYGTASAAQTFSISGSALTDNITATAPIGFEVSNDGTTFGSTVTFTQSGGSASGTLSIRLSATAVPGGTYNSQTIVLSSTGASSVNITTASSGNSVSQKALTVTGATTANKVYDGTNSATVTGGSLVGVVGSDVVTLTQSGTFAQSTVGTSIAITSTSTLGGVNAGYYTLTQPSLTARDITAKSLTVSGATTSNKVYDGTNTATVTGGSLVGIVGSDVVTLTQSGTFAQTSIGTGIAITSTCTLGGANAGNYLLTQPSLTARDITVKALTVSSPAVTSKVYDGTTAATITGTLSGIIGADVVTLNGTGTFASASVASGINVTSTSTLSGAGSGNYTLTQPTGLTGNITAKSLTITGILISNKTYDRTTTATIAGTATYSGLVNGETYSVTGTPSATFADKNVANGKSVTVTGYDAPSGNYSISQPAGLTANITAATLTLIGASVTSKTYDGTTTATITATLSGIISSDVVTLNGTGTFASANVGTGISVISTSTLSGADGGNYTLTQPTGLTGNITQATQTITFTSFTTPITASTTIVASSNVGGAITYSSSNASVATINSSTGVVTIVGNGTTNITASNAGASNFTSATNSQVLTVNSSTVVTLLTWNTFGNAGTETTETSTSNTNVASSTLSLGAGVTAASNSNRFGGSGWFKTGNTNPSLLSEAITANSYIEFTVTPTTGYSITPTSFEFIWDFSGTGPSSVALRSSADNYATNLGTVTGMTTSTSSFKTMSISGLSNITSATTFRLYGYAATATGGTGGFDCASSQNNILLKGTVNCSTPSQSSAISGSATVCSGSSQSYSVTNVSGVGYTWSLPYGWSGTSTTNSINATVASSGGTISVTPYNSATGCTNYTASSQSVAVTVNTTPTISGTTPNSRCDLGTVTLGASASAGTINWYAAASGGSSLGTGTSFTTPSISITTTYYVDATANGCTAGTRTSITATVTTPPNAGTLSGTQGICLTGSTTFTTDGNAGGTWTSGSTGVATVDGSTGVITPVASGTSTITYTVIGTGGCSNATATRTVTVNSNGTWIGDNNDNWNVSGNWCGGVPNSSSAVVSIPSGVTVNLDASPSVLNLTIGSGSTLVANGQTITVASGGSFTNNGTYSVGIGAANLVFEGAGTIGGTTVTLNNLTANGTLTINTSPTVNGTVTINTGGSIITNPITYGTSSSLVYNVNSSINSTHHEWPTSNSPYNVTIQNSSVVTLNEDKTIDGTLTLTSGKITLGSKNLTLNGEISGGSSSCYINTNTTNTNNNNQGAFLRSVSSTGVDYLFPIGRDAVYVPFSIKFNAGDLSNILISSTTHKSKVSNLNSNQTHYLERHWIVEPTSTISGLNYDISLQFNPSEIIGTGNIEDIRPIKYSGGTWYKPVGANFTDGIEQGTASAPSNNTLTWTGLSTFSEFGGAGDAPTPLPIELISFTSSCNENQKTLIWQTASEHNSSHFEIEKSIDGITWSVVGQISAAGNSNQLLSYSYSDYEKTNGYYRLNQIDNDGKNDYFGPVAPFCETEQFVLKTTPNPSKDLFNLQFYSNESETANLEMIDINGRVVYTNFLLIQNGINVFPINSEFPQGVYYIKLIRKNNETITIKQLIF